MTPLLWQLIYTSHATDAFSETELGAILAASHANNPPQGLTGILLYSDGRFIQVLEGARDAVEALYERIKADPRHEAVRRVITREVPQRGFGLAVGVYVGGVYEVEAMILRGRDNLIDILLPHHIPKPIRPHTNHRHADAGIT